jgi:hypothetical protein
LEAHFLLPPSSRHLGIASLNVILTYVKITREKSTGGVTKMVEHLLCQLEALSSNSSLTRKKN